MIPVPMTPSQSHSRPLLAGAILWVVPTAALLDAGIAFIFHDWRPNGTIESALSGVFCLWLLAALLLIHRGIRAHVGRSWRELLMLFVVSSAGYIMLEFTANRLEQSLRPRAPFHTRGPNIHNTFDPDPAYLPGIHGPSHFTTGPGGIRAPAPAAQGQARVLCVGGSTTECVYLDDNETWATLLPNFLEPDLASRVWVGNVGISGFDTRDHLQFVRESPLLAGAEALIVQCGINDLWRFLAQEVEAMDYGRFEDAPGNIDVRIQEKYRPWWTRSRLIQLYHTWCQPPPPPEQREGIGGSEYEIRRSKRRSALLTGELPPLQLGLEAYKQNITAIIEDSRARGVPVLFTTQAVLWQADLPAEAADRCWFGWLPDGRYLSIDALREAMDAYNQTLMDTCSSAGVPWVDLSALHGNPAWFYDDCHFTEAGAVEVARRIAPELSLLLTADDNQALAAVRDASVVHKLN